MHLSKINFVKERYLLYLTDQNVVGVPPIGVDELPPPYTPSSQGGIPMINCKVCQSMINIEGKLHQHVVKCSVCNEATVSLFCFHFISYPIIKYFAQ